jgi:hypothetical protein
LIKEIRREPAQRDTFFHHIRKFWVKVRHIFKFYNEIYLYDGISGALKYVFEMNADIILMLYSDLD